MTGRLRFGKMSIDIRSTARTLPRATATTATITVIGRRIAKTIGFMRARPENGRELQGERPEFLKPSYPVRTRSQHPPADAPRLQPVVGQVSKPAIPPS